MIVIAAGVMGAAIGGFSARRKGGRPADIAQYAAAHAILFGLLGLFLTIAIERML
ncbi:apolipoprotein acyltransferase [Pseudogemmobacter sonorensis]|uniref:apolipoprotein acyltransferase n=1 Tax=Pseudogemmobacter sonorensis TaxID=2989681 RepID=UPI0036CBCB88